MGRWSKAVVAAICGSVVVTIAFSRVYLGAELLSGVLVGGLLALILTSLFAMAIEAIPARRIRPIGLMAFTTAVFMAVGLFHYGTGINRAEARYAPRPMVQTFTAQQWRDGGWEKLSDRRIDPCRTLGRSLHGAMDWRIGPARNRTLGQRLEACAGLALAGCVLLSRYRSNTGQVATRALPCTRG